MSIATNLERILSSKDDIKNAIISKGVTVLDSDKIDVYADKIYQIQQGSEYIVTSKTISENGEYTSSGNEVWNKVTVNVPQTGSDITLTEITITDVGEYTAPEKIAYNKVLVPSETFYKKYTDGEGNTYIINENGEIVVTYTGGTPTPKVPSDEIWYTTTDGDNASSAQEGLISNTYVDGKWVLKFSNIVTEVGVNLFTNNTYKILTVELPNSIENIYYRAFRGCNSLTSVTIPNSVIIIGGETFKGCSSLTSITIPNSVTTIGMDAFMQCTSLTSVEIPNSVIELGNGAFCYCSGLTSATIGSGVTSIGSTTFISCSSLTSVTIPNTVTSIGSYAFIDCSSLTDINYNGTKEQFTSISKKSYWIGNVPDTCMVHCTDGDYPIDDF